MTLPTRLAVVPFALLAMLPARTFGQVSVDAVVGASLDQLNRGGASTESSTAPAATLALEHLAFDKSLRLFYAFDGGTFSSEGDWGYLQHNAGGRYRFSLGQDTGLFLGGTAALRTNGSSWSAADYRGLGVFANLERAFPRGMLRAGLRTDRRVFSGQPGLDHLETATFGSAVTSFQTRTTVIGEVGLGWKRYDEGTEWLPVVTPWTDTTAGTVPLTPGGGAGNGSGSGYQGGGGAHSAIGASAWQRPSEMPGASTMSSSTARQVTLFGRVAQSLADRLAVSFEASRRNVSGAVATASVTTPEMLIDDGVYDDPYASDATVWRVGIKKAFENGRDLDAGVSHWDKLYEATPALDSSGAPIPGVLRDDRIWRVDATWREPIVPGRTGAIELAVVTGYTFMDSVSTDAYYTYSSHRLRAMVAISY